jgi:hypothetical protein
VLKGEADTLAAVARARSVGKNYEFKKVNDEETRRALFPSNYPVMAQLETSYSHSTSRRKS